MKKLFLLLLIPAVLMCGCAVSGSKPDNYPYEPETPAPAAHDGLFVSEHGTMSFTGDGESIAIDFDAYLAKLAGLPEGKHEGSYVFLSGNLPPHGSIPVRYDTAHEMKITVDEQSAVIDMGIAVNDGRNGQVGVNTVTPDRIPMLFRENDLFFQIDFRKEAGGGDTVKNSYTQISQEEAKEMMTRDDGHIIVDVRRQDEYDAGHIPGAVLIPNESIETERPAELPDLNQIILIYCRSGRRSKEAAQKLFDMGYTNIYEFGGINTWTGEIVAEENETTETPIPESENPNDERASAIQPVPTLVIEANGHILYADFEENSSAMDFANKLSSGKIELELHDYGGFEKVGDLPFELPRNDETITTEPGDVILYQGNQITIYYGENTWDFTRLAKIGNVTREELLEYFGDGNVAVTFWVEWSE